MEVGGGRSVDAASYLFLQPQLTRQAFYIHVTNHLHLGSNPQAYW
jgi:hypothetical protein